MQVLHFPDSPRPKWPSPIAALGNFDGLHRGHLKLLERCAAQAGERGGTPVAVIFDPHPPRVLRPDKAPPLLMTLDQKLEALRARRPAGRRHRAVHARAVALGAGAVRRDACSSTGCAWRRSGSARTFCSAATARARSRCLRALGEDRGFRTEKIEPVRYKDFVVSSTRIRHLVGEGRVDEAGALLGHHYFVDGTVVHGDGRGRELGFPTANLETGQRAAAGATASTRRLPIVGGRQHPAVTSVGVRPTIGDGGRSRSRRTCSMAARDLYGEPLRLAFVQWLREERKFDDLEALRAQMADDCATAAALFAPDQRVTGLIESRPAHAAALRVSRCPPTRAIACSRRTVAGQVRRGSGRVGGRRARRLSARRSSRPCARWPRAATAHVVRLQFELKTGGVHVTVRCGDQSAVVEHRIKTG